MTPPNTRLQSLAHAKFSRRLFISSSVASGLVLAAQPVPAQHNNGALPMEITISTNRDVTTLINVFSVEPQRQQALMDLLISGTEAFFSKQPGFVAASFHKSKDGRYIINYAQWRSARDIEAFRGKPDFGAYIKSVAAAATKVEAMVCDVNYVNHA